MLYEHITFRKVDESHIDTVLAIYASNAAYFEQASNSVPTRETVLDDLHARPPHDKHYKLVYVEDEPVAVVDVLTNFPTEKTAHIGLLMVDGQQHAKELGRQILIALEHQLLSFHTLRIGVFEQNEQALHFWQRNGFHLVDTKHMPIGEKEHHILILQKPLPLTATIATAIQTDALATFLATCNRHASQHIGYVGEDAAEIADTLRHDFVQLNDELAVAIVQNDAGHIIGALGLDIDDDHAEVWGPFHIQEQPHIAHPMWQLLQSKFPHIQTFQFFIHEENVQQQAFVTAARRYAYGGASHFIAHTCSL